MYFEERLNGVWYDLLVWGGKKYFMFIVFGGKVKKKINFKFIV